MLTLYYFFFFSYKLNQSFETLVQFLVGPRAKSKLVKEREIEHVNNKLTLLVATEISGTECND